MAMRSMIATGVWPVSRHPQRIGPFLVALLLAVAAVQAQAQDESADPTPSAEPASTAETSEPPDASASETPQPEVPAPAETLPAEAGQEPDRTAPGATELEKITVTAGKRSQALSDLPGSVGALSGKQLEDMAAKGMSDYLKLIPGVSLPESQWGPDASPLIIRGIATSTGFGNINAPGSQTAGVYIDDIPFGTTGTSLQFPDMSPFDLEGVEVLKGPQGTLFGAQALSGAIRYVTHKPELGLWQAKFQGSATSIEESEDENSPYGALAVNVPIGSSAAIRAAGIYREAPGYVDVVTDVRNEKDVNSVRQQAQRVLGKWEIGDDLTLSGSWFEQQSKSNDFLAVNHRERPERYNSSYKVPGDSQFGLQNIVVDYDFGWATLLSSTSRKTQSSVIFADITGAGGGGAAGTPCDPSDPGTGTGPCENSAGTGAEDQNQVKVLDIFFTADVTGYSQELRFVSPDDGGDWRWIAGAYFQRDGQQSQQVAKVVSFTSAPGTPPPPIVETPYGPIDLTSLPYFQQDHADYTGRESSVFGEVTWSPIENWEITAGGRLFVTRSETTVLRYGGKEIVEGVADNGTIRTDSRVDTSSKEKGFNPRFSLRYALSPNVTTYALASKGFQFGGSQITAVPLAPDDPVPLTYKSSTLWNYELGARTEWFDRRLSVDVTLFDQRWTDLQIRGATNDPTGLRVVSFFYVTNAGAAKSEGVELALRGLPFPDVLWSTSATWMQAVTTEPFFDAETKQTLPPGTRLPASPHFQLANVLSYSPQLGAWAPGLSLTHAYIGSSYNNILRDAPIGGYSTLDANVFLLKADSAYQPRLSLALTNVFDTRGVANADGNSARRHPGYLFVRPRTLEMTLEFRFN